MSRKRKIISFIIVLGLIVGGYVFYIAKKRTVSGAESKPTIEITAIQLITEFETSPDAISKKYMDKNIAVIGKIKEVDTDNANVIIEAGDAAFINCSFDSASFVNQKGSLIPGKKTSIKGIYFGYEGFEKSNDEMDLIPSEKNIKMKTCAVNEK